MQVVLGCCQVSQQHQVVAGCCQVNQQHQVVLECCQVRQQHQVVAGCCQVTQQHQVGLGCCQVTQQHQVVLRSSARWCSTCCQVSQQHQVVLRSSARWCSRCCQVSQQHQVVLGWSQVSHLQSLRQPCVAHLSAHNVGSMALNAVTAWDSTAAVLKEHGLLGATRAAGASGCHPNRILSSSCSGCHGNHVKQFHKAYSVRQPAALTCAQTCMLSHVNMAYAGDTPQGCLKASRCCILQQRPRLHAPSHCQEPQSSSYQQTYSK